MFENEIILGTCSADGEIIVSGVISTLSTPCGKETGPWPMLSTERELPCHGSLQGRLQRHGPEAVLCLCNRELPHWVSGKKAAMWNERVEGQLAGIVQSTSNYGVYKTIFLKVIFDNRLFLYKNRNSISHFVLVVTEIPKIPFLTFSFGSRVKILTWSRQLTSCRRPLTGAPTCAVLTSCTTRPLTFCCPLTNP